jgi:nucleoside-diphosphate-sugar epimerase
MQPKRIPNPVMIFGSTGFVGKSLIRNASQKVISPVRVNDEWLLEKQNLGKEIQQIDVIIAVGPARFSSTNSNDYDRNIVSKIYEFLQNGKFQVEKVIYISTLAAVESHSKNSYGISKVKAEEFVAVSFKNVAIFRPPALFGQGMSNESHLNWFLNKKKIFYLFSKFTNSGISLLHVDDFAKIVHKELQNSSLNNQVIYPMSMAIRFRDLAPLLNRKKVKSFREVSVPVASPIASKLPFKLQPLFRPVWVDTAHIGLEFHLDQIPKVKNHVLRHSGHPSSSAPVIVFGGDGGLGRAICNNLNDCSFGFISVDVSPQVDIKDWEFCLGYWQIDLTNDRDIADLYQKMDLIEDVSWIVTAAGRGLRGDIKEFNRAERLDFWKLMLLSRIDLIAWAQKRSIQQEHIGVINVSSSSAYFPLPKYADYSAANNSFRIIGTVGNFGFPKFTLKTIVPGGMKTNLMKDFGDLKKFHAGSMEPHFVAEKLVKMMVTKTKNEVPVGLNSIILNCLESVPLNRLIQKIISKTSERIR